MFHKLVAYHQDKIGTGAQEREKMIRLEQAESDLLSLKQRAARVINRLDARDRKNHWRESIEQMIQGGI